jgi:LAS superfamily LD-carboxypeptidase LdcB
MKKRRKLKRRAKLLILALIILIIGLIVGIKLYQKHAYEQTYEYKLLQINYNLDEINTIKSHFSNDEIDELLNKDYIPKLTDFITEKYFIYANLDCYLAYYQNNPNTDISNIITIVNVDRDSKYYENTTPTDTTKDTLMLVNKYHYLTEDYVPTNLVNVNSTYAYADNIVREDVLEAFKDMYNAALNDNIKLIINSSYRTYQDQEATWSSRKKAYGAAKADAYAARAGFSEHQTGLALDINEYGTNVPNFEDTDAFKWLQTNAYQYGFILRYPDGKENITGYSYESWHYRYVGKEVAQKIINEGITFDEYYAYYIAK